MYRCDGRVPIGGYTLLFTFAGGAFLKRVVDAGVWAAIGGSTLLFTNREGHEIVGSFRALVGWASGRLSLLTFFPKRKKVINKAIKTFEKNGRFISPILDGCGTLYMNEEDF